MKKNITFVASILLLSVLHSAAFASGGVDTSVSGLNSLYSWVRLWLPMAATLGVIGIAIACIFNLMSVSSAVKPVLGLIVAGSAAYLVSFFIS